MPTRLRDTIALFVVFVGITACAWAVDRQGAAADPTSPDGCIAHAFPTAEAGFARQRTAAQN